MQKVFVTWCIKYILILKDYVMSSLLVCSRREGSSIGFRATFSEAPMLDFVPDSALAFAYTARLRASPLKSLLVGHRHTR